MSNLNVMFGAICFGFQLTLRISMAELLGCAPLSTIPPSHVQQLCTFPALYELNQQRSEHLRSAKPTVFTWKNTSKRVTPVSASFGAPLNLRPGRLAKRLRLYSLECATRLGQDVYVACNTGVMACTKLFPNGHSKFGAMDPRVTETWNAVRCDRLWLFYAVLTIRKGCQQQLNKDVVDSHGGHHIKSRNNQS